MNYRGMECAWRIYPPNTNTYRLIGTKDRKLYKYDFSLDRHCWVEVGVAEFNRIISSGDIVKAID